MDETTNVPLIRHQDRLYHDLGVPAEILAIREEVRAFADEHVAPVAHAIGHTEESVASFPRGLMEKMARANLFRIPFAAESGGRGLQHSATATAVSPEPLVRLAPSCASRSRSR